MLCLSPYGVSTLVRVAPILILSFLAGCPGADSTQPVVPDTPSDPTPDTPSDPTPDTPSDPTPDTPSDPQEAAGAVEVLKLRIVRRCCRNLAVALLRVEGEVAHVAVTSGQVSFRAQLVVGDRLRLAAASELELLAVEREALKIRWISEVDEALGEVEAVTPATPENGSVVLEEMGIYTVSGLTVGVGNVRLVPEGAPAVTITVFPENYESNPMQNWDLHSDLLAGDSRKGAVLGLVVEDVGERGQARGWVRLGWGR